MTDGTTRYYYVDEAGDGTLFSARGRRAGQEGHIFNCQLHLLRANGKKTMVEIVGRKR